MLHVIITHHLPDALATVRADKDLPQDTKQIGSHLQDALVDWLRTAVRPHS